MTVTKIQSPEDYLVQSPMGTKKVLFCKQSGPSSYATGGFDTDFVTDLLSGKTIDNVIANSDKGYGAEWVSSTKKTKAYASAGTEESATTDLSGVTFYYTVFYTD